MNVCKTGTISFKIHRLVLLHYASSRHHLYDIECLEFFFFSYCWVAKSAHAGSVKTVCYSPQFNVTKLFLRKQNYDDYVRHITLHLFSARLIFINYHTVRTLPGSYSIIVLLALLVIYSIYLRRHSRQILTFLHWFARLLSFSITPLRCVVQVFRSCELESNVFFIHAIRTMRWVFAWTERRK